jgi:hypothetical protein
VRAALVVAFAALAACTHTPPTPIVQPPSVADLVKTCAFAVSCLKDPPTTQLSLCVGVLQNVLASEAGPSTIYARYVDCARDALDCTSVLRCASRDHDPSYCVAHPGASCDGDLLVQCAAASPVVDWAIANTDCAALGMRCLAANGNANCSDGTPCTPTPGSGHCDGNTFVACDGNTKLTWREDCARSGIVNASCRSDSARAGCFPSGPSCSGSADRCDGDVLVQCVVGEEERVDCARVSGRCSLRSDVTGVYGSCVSLATCSASDACGAATLATCVDGIPQSIDCSAIGLSMCAATHDGRPACG